MKLRKDPNVGENFFEKLKIKKVDLKKLGIKDEPGLNLEEWANDYRVFTLRQDSGKDDYRWYCTTVFNGPEPKDILAQTKVYGFEKAIKTHYSALNYLEKI